jgi:toxin ParE1/3/4
MLRPAARNDILEIAKYIADHNPTAAREWRKDILDACRLLGEFPQVGTARDDAKAGYRTFPKGNYLIIFQADKSGVAIIRVVHAARDWPKLMR